MLRPWIAAGLLLCAGCATPPVTKLTFVTTAEHVVQPRILAEEVERDWCYTVYLPEYAVRFPWRASLVPSYGYAVALALKSVPEANVLVDVEVERRRSEYLLFRRICSTVRGKAGRIE